MRVLLMLLVPALAWADVAPPPGGCGCAVGGDPVATGAVVALVALLVLGRRRG